MGLGDSSSQSPSIKQRGACSDIDATRVLLKVGNLLLHLGNELIQWLGAEHVGFAVTHVDLSSGRLLVTDHKSVVVEWLLAQHLHLLGQRGIRKVDIDVEAKLVQLLLDRQAIVMDRLFDGDGDNQELARRQPQWPTSNPAISISNAANTANIASCFAGGYHTYHLPPKCSVKMAMKRSREP
jgi:hypothetical protein